jgi:uncharacterized protein YkwD
MTKKRKIHKHLKNTFIPHSGNNYRPHTITHYGLAIILLFIIGFQLAYNYSSTGTVKVLGYATNVSEAGLLEFTNNNRDNSNLQNLSINQKLNQAAQAKAEHMIANNYWSHYAPDGTTPWDFINNTGYEYLKAGENLAYGFSDSAGTVNGWMNSKAHADNILDPLFTEVGFGFANGSNFEGNENTVIVAMYAQPLTPSAPSQAQGTTQEAQDEQAPAWTAQDTIRNQETTVPIVSSPAKEVSVFEAVISGNAHWGLYVSLSALLLIAATYAGRHAIAIKQLATNGEHFVMGHPLLEAGLLYALLWLVLAATYGVVQ